jgi:hypothetical protein
MAELSKPVQSQLDAAHKEAYSVGNSEAEALAFTGYLTALLLALAEIRDSLRGVADELRDIRHEYVERGAK